MSRSDNILNRLVELTNDNGGFVKAWKRTGFDVFIFTVTGHAFSKVWANSVLQLCTPGADLDELFPVARAKAKAAVLKIGEPARPEVAKPAGTLTPGQWRSIADADEAAEGRRRSRR